VRVLSVVVVVSDLAGHGRLLLAVGLVFDRLPVCIGPRVVAQVLLPFPEFRFQFLDATHPHPWRRFMERVANHSGSAVRPVVGAAPAIGCAISNAIVPAGGSLRAGLALVTVRGGAGIVAVRVASCFIKALVSISSKALGAVRCSVFGALVFVEHDSAELNCRGIA
jgi:hypothetical protein